MEIGRKPVRIAVIGVGSMGRNHARILAKMDGAHLVAVVDQSEATRKQVAAATGAVDVASVAEAIALGIDAAVVSVPTVHHYAVVRELIEAGIHVLVEKPIAATLEDAADLIRRAEARGVVLTVGHIERFNPAVRAMRDAIGEEPIIAIAISRVGPFPPRINDVGIVIDLGVHDIDLVRWIGRSEIVEHQALLTKSRGAHEDIAFLQFRLENGALAHINTNWLTPFKERKISVSTATRFIVCDLLLRTVNEYSGFTAEASISGLSPGSYVSRSLNVPFVEPLHAEDEAFLNAVRGKADVVITGFDGMRTLAVALDCLKDAD
jgi:UDP-N-acetylglucosamine 3-dehydrogenase